MIGILITITNNESCLSGNLSSIINYLTISVYTVMKKRDLKRIHHYIYSIACSQANEG